MSDTRLAITGGKGFLGWHSAARILAETGAPPLRIGRSEFSNYQTLAAALEGASTVWHLAGVNRPQLGQADVEEGNEHLARILSDAIQHNGHPVHIVYANSVQALTDSPYGRGKRQAAGILERATERVGGTVANVLLPNLFGEHGRPNYNSFVATFCAEVANGRQPEVTRNREIPILHAQDAVKWLLDASIRRENHMVEPIGSPRTPEFVLSMINSFHSVYRLGEIPELPTEFAVNLFNTYRSFAFSKQPTYSPTPHTDARGRLVEVVRAHGGTGQAFSSITLPGMERGNHWHLQKFERFFVVQGEAEIGLRRLYSNAVQIYSVSGVVPTYVDMPTMWVHNIRNIGSSDLVTAFWSNQLFDPDHTDQFPRMVEDTE